MQLKAGTRLRSAVCETEVVVVKASGDDVDLRCGGHPMLPIDAALPDGLAPEPADGEGTTLGKRYTDEPPTIEVLCTKPGASSLAIGSTPLVIKGAKPLPSSD